MASSTPLPDLYRFHCHGCNRRLRLSRANAGNELRCSSCGVRFTAPAPAEDEALGLPTSTPARAARRSKPQVVGVRSGVLNHADDETISGEDEFERSIDAMAALGPELIFPVNPPIATALSNTDINHGDMDDLLRAESTSKSQLSRPNIPAYHLWHVLVGTSLGLAGGLIVGLLLAMLVKR